MGRPCKSDDVGPGSWGQDLGPFLHSEGGAMPAVKKASMRISGTSVRIEPMPRPVCRMFERCEGCPYPAHGFICWGPDKGYLRSEMQKIYARKESIT